MADEQVTLDVDADITRARRRLEELDGRAVDLLVEIDEGRLRSELRKIDRQLDRLRGDLSVAVAIDDKGEADRLRKKIDALGARRESVQIKVDEVGARQTEAAIDRAAQDQTATITVDADASAATSELGSLDDVLSSGGGGGLLGSVQALGSGAGLGQVASGLASTVGPAALAAGAAASAKTQFDFLRRSVENFTVGAKEVRVLSQVTGATVEDASRLTEVARRFGADGNDIADVLLNIQQLAAEGGIPDIGLQLDPGGSAVENLRLIADAYAAAGSDAEKAAIASQALGEEGARQFVPLISEGADEMERLLAAVPEGSIFTEADVVQAQKLDAATTRLSQQFTGFQNDIARGLVGPLTEFADLLDSAGPLLDAIGTAFGTWIGGAISFVSQEFRMFLGLIQAGADALDKLAGPLLDLPDDLFAAEDGAKGTADGLDGAAGAAGTLGGNIAGAADETRTLADVARDVDTAFSSITDPFSQRTDAAAQIQDARDALDQLRSDQAQAGAVSALAFRLELPPDAITRLQQQFAAAGLDVPVTGVLDRATLAAIRSQAETAGLDIPAKISPATITQQQIADARAKMPTLDVPTRVDAQQLGDQLVAAAQSEVVSQVQLGSLPAEEATDRLLTRLRELRGQQVRIGVDPAVTGQIDKVVNRLATLEARAQKAAEAAAKQVARSGGSADAATRAAETAGRRARAEVTVTADTDAADAAIAKTSRNRTAEMTAEVDDTDAADQLDTLTEPRTVRVTVRADGLAAIVSRWAALRDKRITLTVDQRGQTNVQGNWSGGPLGRGDISEVAEHGPEIWEGRSGQSFVITDRSLFVAPEPGRVVSGAETARRLAPRVTDRSTSVGSITVVSPHPLLAGLDVHRALIRRSAGR